MLRVLEIGYYSKEEAEALFKGGNDILVRDITHLLGFEGARHLTSPLCWIICRDDKVADLIVSNLPAGEILKPTCGRPILRIEGHKPDELIALIEAIR